MGQSYTPLMMIRRARWESSWKVRGSKVCSGSGCRPLLTIGTKTQLLRVCLCPCECLHLLPSFSACVASGEGASCPQSASRTICTTRRRFRDTRSASLRPFSRRRTMPRPGWLVTTVTWQCSKRQCGKKMQMYTGITSNKIRRKEGKGKRSSLEYHQALLHRIAEANTGTQEVACELN